MIKHDLIEQVGGIERAREIVDGAPDKTADTYCVGDWGIAYFSLEFKSVWCAEDNDWFDSDYETIDELGCDYKTVIALKDLRTAIAEYDNPQLCIDCGSSDLYKGGEIKKPKMCFKCYAAMTGFTLIGDQLMTESLLKQKARFTRLLN